MKKRLDLLLVEKKFFETREKAKREIMAGNVIVNEQAVTKAGMMFKDTDELNIRIKDKLKYVSRGGLKLEKAIKIWNLDFKDKLVLDIGASTGGFTDCSLQNGAKLVFSVDVGKNQLDWKLRNNDKDVAMEELHIPYFKKFLSENGKIIMLIKPQFEVGREKIGKNGVVENEEYHDEAIKKIISFSKECGYTLVGVEDSPIKGTKGNKEFLIYLKNCKKTN